MANELQTAGNLLFDKEGLQANNLKLFPGTNRDVSAEQFAQQINNAVAQIANGDYDLIEEEL